MNRVIILQQVILDFLGMVQGTLAVASLAISYTDIAKGDF
jgi:hypothetical protein